jgi:UDP-4-amino-4-deoxy-L-arabinose formyltransferase/UDP-glucuronic acid dehydrogenase (UDP-4-keto-hexauronic acid decarboxylating)
MNKKKVVLFGSIPTAAECLAELVNSDSFDVCGVVTQTGYRCAWASESPHVEDVARENSIPIIQLNDIPDMKCDWGFSVRFNSIVKPEIISSFSKHIINIHGGPLPYYRGQYCANWAIIDGRDEFGITAHLIDAGIDTGDVVKTVWWGINKTDTAGDLFFRALKEIPILFSSIIESISEDGDVPHIPQDNIQDKSWPIRTSKANDLDEQRNIDVDLFKSNPEKAADLIRAFDFPNHKPLTVTIAGCEISLSISNIDESMKG